MKTLLNSRTVQMALVQAISGILVAVLTEMDAVGYVAIVKSVADILLRLDTKDAIDSIV
jgi:hypothetical protein